ncbi:MAG TPA: YidC/Oxa1 family membrane protein insertase [Dehalococcoidia bacterium]|nr:YidC/Oxa1 family membrane protein insertase [Dehalococcoidia bacterium]
MAELWSLIILDPVLNGLIALSGLLPREVQFGLAIIILTIVVRLILTPITLRQLSSTKHLQDMQPKMQELQKKYARNKQKLQQETMKLYKEAGVNPIGCMWPMLVQFPVWIALYQSIMKALATTPENLLDLSRHLYSWQIISQALPLNSHFLWLDLGQPDSFFILAILVGGSMWVQQKMSTAPTTDPRQQSTSSMMQIMMPFMFGLFCLMFPSGLALYWLVSNIITIATQYFITGGWGYLKSPFPMQSGSRRRS